MYKAGSYLEFKRSVLNNDKDSKLNLREMNCKSQQDLWILSCEEAVKLAFRGLVVLFRCLLVPEIMHGGAPKVCHMTYNVLMRCKSRQRKNIS
jgi:hypothetical protein